MGRLKANYNSSKNNKISIKKQNLGGGTLLLNYIFDPKEIQGLSLWLKADAGVTLDGSNVIAWADQSNNGNNATPVTDNPIYNISDLNSKPTISLTSMSDYVERVFSISINPLGAIGSTAFSVQYVEDVCDANNDNGPIFGNFGATIDDGEPYSQTHYPYGPDCSVYDSFATTSRKNSLTPPATITNAWTLYSVKSTDNDWQSFVNGRLMYSDPTNTYSNEIGGDDTTLYIGKQTAGGTYELKGKVAEVIVYNRVLTTSERQQVETYLREKYAITCGYRNINKLVQTAGSNAPIGATFDNIAFDYASFAGYCSALGLDPATILNDLEGLDFSSNYVVIRAKTSSTINSDSISDLGGGVINITNAGPSGGAINNYYRFFVMCKDGWNTVRFNGVNYPI